MAKVMDKQGKTEKLSQTRRDWGGMTTKWDAILWTESWNRKADVNRKAGEIQRKCGV